jgi:hypothetical protein
MRVVLVLVGGLLLAVPVMACAQTTARVSTKRFVDPETGVSFRYPAAWSSKTLGILDNDPLDREMGRDDARPPKVRLQVGWKYISHFYDDNLKAEFYVEHDADFAYAVLPEPTAEDCAARFVGWQEETVKKPDVVTLNGVQFNHVLVEDAGTGHTWSHDVYTTFQHGKCLGFSVGNDTEVYEDGPHKMSKAAEAVSTDADAVMKTVRIEEPVTGEKLYSDKQAGVSFSYPAMWKMDDGLGDYLGTEILSGDGPESAIAKVGFHGIPNTNLTNVVFVYAMTTTPDEKSCYSLASTEDDNSAGTGWVTIAGRRYWHVDGGDGGLSHSANEQVYATYRTAERQCLLFEEDVDSVAANVEDWAKPVSKERLNAIYAQMKAVMLSVRVGPSTAALPPHHRAMPLRSYFDPETGVSIRYPAAWKASMGQGYGNEPLTEYTTANPHPPKARLQVGWSFPINGPDPNDSELTVAQVTFAYAVLPEKTPTTCRKAFDDWDTEGSKDIVVHGVMFHGVEYQDAGLGHSWTVELYTTFHGGRCLGFSVGNQSSHPDDPLPFSHADEAVSADADGVFRSVRLRPVKNSPTQANPAHLLFPQPQPITDGNPAVRHEVEVKVPTRLIVLQSDGKVSFAISPTDFETAKLSVGEKMVTGLNVVMRRYPEDKPPASPWDDILSEQAESPTDIGEMLRDYSGMASAPMTSPRMVVEADLVIFETDIPPQHMWRPKEGKQYRVLWERALKQVVQMKP